MKKLTFSIVAALGLCLLVPNTYAQKSFYKQPYKTRNSGSFDRNTNLLSFGLGAPYAWHGYNVALPPVYVKYEHGLIDEVGIGVFGGLGLGHKKAGKEKNNYSISTIGVLGYYHFNKLIPVSKLDVYAAAGFAVSFEHWNYGKGDYTDNDSSFDPVGKVGARYYFNPSFSVYAEAGYDALGPVNAGITLRF